MAHSCTQVVSHSKVRVEENGRKAVFRNETNVDYEVSKIDSCVVTSGPRADYLVTELGVASVIVELKGRDVAHALEQIFASVAHSDVKKLLEDRIGFLVVCSRYPRFDTFVMRAKTKAAQQFKAGLHIVTNRCETDISEVVKIDGRV